MIQSAANLHPVLDEDVQYLPVEKPRFFAVSPTSPALQVERKQEDDFRPRWWRVDHRDER